MATEARAADASKPGVRKNLGIRQPKLGGVATAQKLLTNFRGLPVIFTSGYSQESENVGAATNADYLQKPYSPMALGRQVREILDQIKARENNQVSSRQAVC